MNESKMKICCSDSLIFCWIWEHFDKILTHFSFCSLRRFIWSKFWAANDDLSQLLVASSTRFKLLKAFQSGSHSQRGHQINTLPNAFCQNQTFSHIFSILIGRKRKQRMSIDRRAFYSFFFCPLLFLLFVPFLPPTES